MKEYSVQAKLMGSAFTLGIVIEDARKAQHFLEMGIAEIQRIEQLLSHFDSQSETSKINTHAHLSAVEISDETFNLIKRSIAIARLSKGDFDISVSPLKKLYRFKNTNFEMPQAETIKKTLQYVGYEKIILDKKRSSISFSETGLQIDFSAIGKGYASDSVMKLWKQKGVQSGYINASGDLNAFGKNEKNNDWQIGIAHPDNKNEIMLYIPVKDSAVATSGDYEQYFIYEGKRFAHNINPHNGLPISGIKSVTVFSPSAELSDALATAVFVKGVERGIYFIDQLPQTEAIIIDENNKIYCSKNLHYAQEKK